MTAQSIASVLAPRREAVRQVASFGAIGVVSTLAYVALYAWLREATPAGVANATALVITAVGNTAANRWLTFGVRGGDGLVRDHAAGLMAFGVALAMTSGSLGILGAIAPRAGRWIEVVVLVATNAAATVVRFLLLRQAIDRVPDARMPIAAGLATLSQSKRTRG